MFKSELTAVFLINACWYFTWDFFRFRLNRAIFSSTSSESSLLHIFATNRALKSENFFISKKTIFLCTSFYLCPRRPFSPLSLANINTCFNQAITNTLITLIWIINPYWQILENSSSYPEISVFRGATQTVFWKIHPLFFYAYLFSFCKISIWVTSRNSLISSLE